MGPTASLEEVASAVVATPLPVSTKQDEATHHEAPDRAWYRWPPPLHEFVRTFRIENEQDVKTQLISGNYF